MQSAPSISEAKKFVDINNNHSVEGAPGVCTFDNPDEYRLAKSVMEKLFVNSPIQSWGDDVDHEIEHFLKAKNLGCDVKLCYIFGIDNKKFDKTVA